MKNSKLNNLLNLFKIEYLIPFLKEELKLVGISYYYKDINGFDLVKFFNKDFDELDIKVDNNNSKNKQIIIIEDDYKKILIEFYDEEYEVMLSLYYKDCINFIHIRKLINGKININICEPLSSNYVWNIPSEYRKYYEFELSFYNSDTVNINFDETENYIKILNKFIEDFSYYKEEFENAKKILKKLNDYSKN